MHYNVPPLCCLVCLPHAKFTRKFYTFCEILIFIYVFFCVFVGFLKLVMSLNGADAYPSTLITGDFAIVYHVLLIIFLLFAIYGLSGIYHSAEEKLASRRILRKFLVYKIFTLLAKFQDVVLGVLVDQGVITDEEFGYNQYVTAGMRVRNIVGFAVVLEAMIAFPFAIQFYSTRDYLVESNDDDRSSEGQNMIAVV